MLGFLFIPFIIAVGYILIRQWSISNNAQDFNDKNPWFIKFCAVGAIVCLAIVAWPITICILVVLGIISLFDSNKK